MKILNENDQFSEIFPPIFVMKILKFCTKMVKFLDISWKFLRKIFEYLKFFTEMANILEKFFILEKKISFGWLMGKIFGKITKLVVLF